MYNGPYSSFFLKISSQRFSSRKTFNFILPIIINASYDILYNSFYFGRNSISSGPIKKVEPVRIFVK